MDAIAIPQPVAERDDAPGGSAPAAEPLFRKLSWLTLFRLLTITVLLGGTAIYDLRSRDAAGGPGALYALVAATYAASLGFALALRARWRLERIAYAQIAVDILIAAAVVALTGYAESVFVILFLLAIVNGSILLFRRGAFASAALSLATYFPLAFAGTPRPEALALFVHASAFVATAALAGYLAEQLRRTDERLAVREGDLATITALHESIVHSVTSGIVTVDSRGRITLVNRAAEEMLGIRGREVRGQPADRWLGSLEAGVVTRSEADVRNAGGEVLRVGYSAFPLVGQDQRALGSAIIFQDLTAVRAMEQQVKRSERLADLGRIAAGLAHELRNPLASMMGSIELLRANRALSGDDAHLTEIVLREAGRLEQLVAHLLEFTRPEAVRRADVDLAELARDTLDVFENDPEAAQVRVEADLAPVRAWCDADQIRQVLWNLLRNAAESAAGREDGAGRVLLQSRADADGARIVVEDNGAGIAPADLPHLFTPFFTTKPDGTGLGLATVHRIAEAHGGSVSVELPHGGGARFSVSLPAYPGRDRS